MAVKDGVATLSGFVRGESTLTSSPSAGRRR
jgi:hypothetical protein